MCRECRSLATRAWKDAHPGRAYVKRDREDAAALVECGRLRVARLEALRADVRRTRERDERFQRGEGAPVAVPEGVI